MQVVSITFTVLVVRGCCVNCENTMGKLGTGYVASVYSGLCSKNNEYHHHTAL